MNRTNTHRREGFKNIAPNGLGIGEVAEPKAK